MSQLLPDASVGYVSPSPDASEGTHVPETSGAMPWSALGVAGVVLAIASFAASGFVILFQLGAMREIVRSPRMADAISDINAAQVVLWSGLTLIFLANLSLLIGAFQAFNKSSGAISCHRTYAFLQFLGAIAAVGGFLWFWNIVGHFAGRGAMQKIAGPRQVLGLVAFVAAIAYPVIIWRLPFFKATETTDALDEFANIPD